MAKPLVLIVTGPCGSGKTTVSRLIAERRGLRHISGDDIKKELFPDIERITDYPEKLEKVKEEIFFRSNEHYSRGESVVIDYVILGRKQIDEYRNQFANNLHIKILLPKREVILERDKLRDCWTAGEKCATELYDKFEILKEYISPEHYVDNSDETPEETYHKHFSQI